MKHPKVTEFQLLHFPEQDGVHHVILIYALADDGIIYELSGGKWAPFPIKDDFMRNPFPRKSTPPLPQ